MRYIGHSNVLELKTTKDYAILKCKKNGIDIICTNNVSGAKSSHFVFKLGYARKMIYLPVRIMQAYNLGEEFCVEEIEPDHFIVIRDRIQKVKPLDVQAAYPDIDWDNMPVLRKKNMVSGKFSLKEEESPGLLLKIEAFCGERNFVQITPLNNVPDNLCSMTEIKEEYGATLLAYPYDSLVFYVDYSNAKACVKKGFANAVQLPLPFIRNWGNDCNDPVEIRGIWKKQLIISPTKRICSLDGKMIDPAKEPIKKIHACEDCSTDKEDIKEMVMMIKNMTSMCKELKECNYKLTDRVERLEALLL